MKHSLSPMKALCLTAVLSLSAMGVTLPKIVDAKINSHTKLPEGWLIQAQKADKDATIATKNAKGLSQPLVLAPKQQSGIVLFSGTAIPSLKGDAYTLSAKISGQGKVLLGYCAYSSSNKYLHFWKGEIKDIQSDKIITISGKLSVVDGKEFPVANIRPVLQVMPKGKITVTEITIQDTED